MATTIDLEMYIGEDKTFTETIYQADGTTVQDITGWSDIQFVIEDRWGNQLVTKTIGGGITVVSRTVGPQLSIAVARADTLGWAPDNYRYRVERADLGADGVLTEGSLTMLSR